MLEYLDFDLEIGLGEGREYPLAVLRSPAGEARQTMLFPFDELALERYLNKLQIAFLRSSSRRRQALSAEEQAAQEFGRALFDALFSGEVRSLYDVSRERTVAQEKGLRLRLRIRPPELAYLPWEFLFDSRQGEYLCLSQYTPLVRYLEISDPPHPLEVQLPLRVLGMIACPSDLPSLDIEREKERLEKALRPLQQRGLALFSWLEGQTWRDLQNALGESTWHIFHFIGHGGFDEKAGEGLLAFVDENGTADRIRATLVARILADHRTLRLAVLNACEGAAPSQRDLFSSTAAILVRRGLPAVLAMQYAITDRAAIELTRVFYEWLARGWPVDASLAQARKALSVELENSLEWGIPVLYMHAPDGVLFSLPEQEVPMDKKVPGESAPAKILSGAYGVIQRAYSAFLHLLRKYSWKTYLSIGLSLLIVVMFLLAWIFNVPPWFAPPPTQTPQAQPTWTVEVVASAPTQTATATASEATEQADTATAAAETQVAQTALASLEIRVTTVVVAVPTSSPTLTKTSTPTQTRTPSKTNAPTKTQTPPPSLTPSKTPTSTQVSSPTEFQTPPPQFITDAYGVHLALVPAGSFQMGSSGYASDERPVHTVSVSAFYIDQYEVTNDHYQDCVAAGMCDAPEINKSYTRSRYYNNAQFGDYPVIYVSWDQARIYCEWRGGRLPTEAEWEKAARGGLEGKLFPWGDDYPVCTVGAFNGAQFGSCKPNDTVAVGSFFPNGYGLYDMAGNVWEWVNDWYQPDYYSISPAIDPPGPFSGTVKILRGGGWFYDWVYSRTSSRITGEPIYRNDSIGFRCAVPLP